MTDRLYYNDPHLVEFDATVTSVEPLEGKPAVRLDRTAFYPTSGGQPHDLGTLGTARVVDVIDADGDVLHVVDGEIAVGASVHGTVDWSRRLDHMQQHTGQHVLSAAFDRVAGARTESFHLGADHATIDLGRELTPAEIARAEDEANRIVWEDRPVKISFVDAAEAAKLPLRKESLREGLLRLIDVEDYDLSACGGTHVRRTGVIGVIAVTGWERFKGGMRVGFVCGGRALRAHRTLRDIAAASVRSLSVLPVELPGAIERLQAELKDARRSIKDLQLKLAEHEAASLAAAASNGRVIAALDGWDQLALKAIASAIAAKPGHAAALISRPGPSAIVVARHPDAPVDAAAVLKQVVQKFGGKGGGRPELAQGGGLQADPDAIVSYLGELL
ncbi:MAG TPA: DHHA1 domain-containing protein [Vicinamibacterales bacterium]